MGKQLQVGHFVAMNIIIASIYKVLSWSFMLLLLEVAYIMVKDVFPCIVTIKMVTMNILTLLE